MRGLLQESDLPPGHMRRALHNIHGPRVIPELTPEERELIRRWEAGSYRFPSIMVDENFSLVVPEGDRTNLDTWRLLSMVAASYAEVRVVELTAEERRANDRRLAAEDTAYTNFVHGIRPRAGLRAAVEPAVVAGDEPLFFLEEERPREAER